MMDEPTRPIAGTDATVGDFWRWAFSDILSNDVRGAFAEFLIGHALEVVDQPRVSWDAVDLRYRGHGIEVKASGRGQTWPQERPSKIVFGIGKRRAWDAETNTMANEATRRADLYVFAYHDPYPATVDDVLDVSTWQFFVVATSDLEQAHGAQKTIGLGAVEALTASVDYKALRAAVENAINRLD